ncbi:MAG TPA: DUF2079 domain-containing protein [Candidatus Dormibacteraeota bacterium]|nr:DUF2079 domain-containing protein [Candidatus Dormibacteraeota bacterium]
MTVEAARIEAAPSEAAESEAWWVFPTVPMVAAAVAFAWTLHGDLQRIYGMTGVAWDFAYDQQVIWNISQGHGFYSSFARANFLGIHFELIFVALAAIEKFWPNPAVLLIFSSAGLAATAPAAYLFLRAILPADRVASPWLAIALSAPIPFWAATQEAARDFFHPENMALAFALIAAWAGIRGHRVVMWLFCLLTLTCKEDQVYTVAVIAILMSVHGAPQVKKHWRLILYLAAGWFVIVTGLIQQRIRNGGYSDFVYYSWLLGLDPSMPLTPFNVAQAVTRPEALLVVAGVIASMFAMQLLAWRWMALVIPPYLADVLSEHDPQNVLHLHYVLLLLFPLIVAGGVGARNFVERSSLRPALALAMMLPALILAWGAGRFPPALGANPSLYSRPNTVVELSIATSMIPANAPVNADPALAVWLANRHTINDFPSYLDNSCYVVIDRNAYLSGPTHPDERQRALDNLAPSGRRMLFDDGRFVVWSPVGD